MALELQKLTQNMRILHKGGRQSDKTLFFKYYKWILWFTFTLYFLTSFFITNKPIPLSKSRVSASKSSVASRVLFESAKSNKTRHKSKPKNPASFKDLKIYIYELPSEYNEDWLSNQRCRNHLFASEVAIHRALMNTYDLRTFDPYEADFFSFLYMCRATSAPLMASLPLAMLVLFCLPPFNSSPPTTPSGTAPKDPTTSSLPPMITEPASMPWRIELLMMESRSS
ncbi:hypothetical protein GQ457_09G013880 [Hibiscus cannabinus]